MGSFIIRLFAIPLTNVVFPAPRGPFKRRIPKSGNFFVNIAPKDFDMQNILESLSSEILQITYSLNKKTEKKLISKMKGFK